jgi:hypothetical protein
MVAHAPIARHQKNEGCHMQSRSNEFRAQAAECQEIANRFRDLIKLQYEELSQQWLKLAQQAEWQHSWTELRQH